MTPQLSLPSFRAQAPNNMAPASNNNIQSISFDSILKLAPSGGNIVPENIKTEIAAVKVGGSDTPAFLQSIAISDTKSVAMTGPALEKTELGTTETVSDDKQKLNEFAPAQNKTLPSDQPVKAASTTEIAPDAIALATKEVGKAALNSAKGTKDSETMDGGDSAPESLAIVLQSVETLKSPVLAAQVNTAAVMTASAQSKLLEQPKQDKVQADISLNKEMQREVGRIVNKEITVRTSNLPVQQEFQAVTQLVNNSLIGGTETGSLTQLSSTAPIQTSAHELSRMFVDRQLNLSRDSLWLNDLARDIVDARQATDRLSFRLSPEHLGRLDVDLATSDAGMSLHMKTSSEEAAKIVSAAQHRLTDELKAQGVRVANSDVSHGNATSREDSQNKGNQRNPAEYIEYSHPRDDAKAEARTDRPSGRVA